MSTKKQRRSAKSGKKGRKKDKSTSKKRKTPLLSSTPSPLVIGPNVYEILERQLQREKAARTAVWLLYTDAPTYIKDTGLEDPPVKKKEKTKILPVVQPPALNPSLLPVISVPDLPIANVVRLDANGNPIFIAEELAKKKAIQLHFNTKDFELKPEEEAWIAGEHLGDTDSGSEDGSVKHYLTNMRELYELQEFTAPWNRRREQRKLIENEPKVSKSNLEKADEKGKPLAISISVAAVSPVATEQGQELDTGGGGGSRLVNKNPSNTSIATSANK